MQELLGIVTPSGRIVRKARVPLFRERDLQAIADDFRQLCQRFDGELLDIVSDPLTMQLVDAALGLMPTIGLEYTEGWAFIVRDYETFAKLFICSQYAPDSDVRNFDGGEILQFHLQSPDLPHHGRSWLKSSGDTFADWFSALAAGGDNQGAWLLFQQFDRSMVERVAWRLAEMHRPEGERKQEIAMEEHYAREKMRDIESAKDDWAQRQVQQLLDAKKWQRLKN